MAEEHGDGGRLELSFSTPDLREICETYGAAVDALGPVAAQELKQRLADFGASESVAELAKLHSESVFERSATEREFRLSAGYTIVFCSGHARQPAGPTVWERVIRMRITAIEVTNV